MGASDAQVLDHLQGEVGDRFGATKVEGAAATGACTWKVAIVPAMRVMTPRVVYPAATAAARGPRFELV